MEDIKTEIEADRHDKVVEKYLQLLEENKQLKLENAELKKRVASFASQYVSLIEQNQQASRRQYETDSDYLPYHEYEER